MTIFKRSFPVLLTGVLSRQDLVRHLPAQDLLLITPATDQYDHSTLEHRFSLPILPKAVN